MYPYLLYMHAVASSRESNLAEGINMIFEIVLDIELIVLFLSVYFIKAKFCTLSLVLERIP